MKKILIASQMLAALICATAQPQSPITFRGAHPVAPLANGNLLIEAEEFQPTGKDGWRARKWGENYYAATFANSFISRKAFLGAGEQAAGSATIKVRIPKAGRYLVLVRYEAAYRFETQFRVRVEQKGRRVLDRLYGARKNLKIWAFSQKLKTEHAWSWGASENIVWEGHNAYADLQAGVATLSLITAKQPGPAARRNVDCLLLTTDEAQVKMRIEKEKYLPLDGMLTQAGDVLLQVTNLGSSELTFFGKGAAGGGNWQQHSPYWVHLRNWPTVSVKVAPGKSSDWVEVGGTMDTLNDGQWNFSGSGKYRAEFAVKEADGKLTAIAKFKGEGDLLLAGDADTRYSRRLRRQEQVMFDLLAEVKKEPLRGRIPTETLIYGYTFTPGLGPKYDASVTEFREMFGLRDTQDKGGTYIDVRGVPTAKLAEYCKNLGARARQIRCVSLGDEIGLPQPRGKDVTTDFIAWLKGRGLKPVDVLPTAKDWTAISFNPDDAHKAKQPGVFYWSRRYRNHYGIQTIKQRTDILRKHLPNAGIGANFSPHYPAEHRYLGEVHKWVTIFREEGMTMPWSEDYIFQMPVATQQMNNINLDLLRAGVRGKPNQKIHYYCMPHWPGQIPDNWRRLFYGALGHGMQVVNLFEFRPVQAAYTENHCSNPETYRTILRSFRELGEFEDIIQSGRKRKAKAAMWFSETGDIWGDNHGSFAAGKRTFYTMIIHMGHSLDFIIEGDALDGYNNLFLTDRHVSRAASRKIAGWVKAGGHLHATAGAGMFDEFNQPNIVLRELLGLKSITLEAPAGEQIEMVKQDLPFAKAIDSIRFPNPLFTQRKGEPLDRTLPVFSVRCKVQLADDSGVKATFKDGSPAVYRRWPTGAGIGKGEVTYTAFLPGFTYYHSGIPRIPVDRGTHPGASSHLIPSQLNHGVMFLSINMSGLDNSVCVRDRVEANVIDSPKGSVIILTNWYGKPSKNLVVTLPKDLEKKKVKRASGKPFKRNGDRVVLNLDVADALILR